MATATQVLAELAALAGENEAVLGGNNTTVNKFFSAAGAAYCGYALMYAMKKAGCDLLDKCANAAYVPTLKSYLAAQGWQASNSAAQAGDIFAYNNAHVGFVYAPYSGTTVITLEGNSTVYDTLAKAKASASGTGAYEGIGFKKRTLTSAYTIYRPPYDGGSGASASTTTGGATNYIKKFQTWLNTSYKTGLSVDGIYGPRTKAGAVRGWQTAMNAAYSTGLAADGIFGVKSKAAAKKYPVKSGAAGALAYIVQGMLYCRGYDPGGFDGIYGSGTMAAVKKFQSAKGITADGVAGVDTFTKMFG